MTIKFRKGDIVSVQGTVTYVGDGDDDLVHVEIPGSIRSDSYIKADALTVVRQNIIAGDQVEGNFVDAAGEMQTCTGTAIAISNDHVWIDMGGGDYCTKHISYVKRAES